MASYLLAVDVGGTKTATAVVSDNGEILQLSQAPTALSGPPALVDQIITMLRDDQRRAGVDSTSALALGVGIPAVISPDHRVVVWAPNLPGWEKIPLYKELVARLHLPVRIEYDGHTAVLGECWLGAGQGYRNVVCVIVGTGIGAGMMLDGRLYRGRDGIAGAVGWFALTSDARPPTNPEARSVGHWESLSAGPAIASKAQQQVRSGKPSILEPVAAQRELSAKDVFEAARQGDVLSVGVLQEAAERIGLGVANIVSLVNPEIVILGGSIGRQSDLILEPVRRVVQNWAQPISAKVQIVCSTLGENAGILGAAYTAQNASSEFTEHIDTQAGSEIE
jgi:glucokinase